jgi:hypothetical protein
MDHIMRGARSASIERRCSKASEHQFQMVEFFDANMSIFEGVQLPKTA